MTKPFVERHCGLRSADVTTMLQTLGYASLDALIDVAVPQDIRSSLPELPPALSEHDALAALRTIAAQNQVWKSYLGMGYYGTLTPPVLQRNILENPAWYTPYTPYQAEISQGRLTALLNFQTMVSDLTGLPMANASLLDEATAAAEAMHLCDDLSGGKRPAFFVSQACHPQTIAVVQTRAEPLGIQVIVGDHTAFDFVTPVSGVLLQYPDTTGRISDFREYIARAKANGALVVMATDLLALTLLTPPGELGADVALGSSQRFGVPMGFGGPHAAFFATTDACKRSMPGRLVGVSIDAHGAPALRLALQTREQHIRRAKATSNICTAQALLAVTAGMYATYHGPAGLTHIATTIHGRAQQLAAAATAAGWQLAADAYFDTITLRGTAAHVAAARTRADAARINLRVVNDTTLGISLDETTSGADLRTLIGVVTGTAPTQLAPYNGTTIPAALRRTSPFLTAPVFTQHHSETEMMRYLSQLSSMDLALTNTMIPLGSCTMKLNAAAEMYPVTWPEFGALHPFAPAEQTRGYQQLCTALANDLAAITGFDAVSLQPNAGSQGEYAGLLVIRAYHRSRGDTQRTVCLIPHSAHGTNPASAAMAGMEIVGVHCEAGGDVDLNDLRAKAAQHADRLAALMITYPSTHGVFETTIREICDIVHQHGGQVYLDGANMNALVGLCKGGEFGADVCHLNLHKTFCIPHGGGGPGMGPIGVKSHLAAFLPGHNVVATGGARAIGPIAAAPFSSASILPIPYQYIRMMGADGLRTATQLAILNANYIAKRLAPYYPIVFTGAAGLVAHECIIDIRPFKATAGIEVEDVAKRLIDYGFHAPTMSWPIPGTLMIEPTESEPLCELDRFCEAMIAIHAEIQAIANGTMDREHNVLKYAPHTAAVVTADAWDRPYSRSLAAWPVASLRAHKYWSPVGRVNNAHGDRNLVCTCDSVAAVEARQQQTKVA